jgi:hypothetical protein
VVERATEPQKTPVAQEPRGSRLLESWTDPGLDTFSDAT